MLVQTIIKKDAVAKMGRKIFYWSYLLINSYFIGTSLINFIYCIFKGSTELFFGSVYCFSAPVLRYIYDKNPIELILSIILFAVTIVLFILSLKEIFHKDNKKSPFILLYMLNYFLFLNPIYLFLSPDVGEMMNDLSVSAYSSSIILIFLLVALILAKSSEQTEAMRRNKDFEDPLPENFQWSAKSYKQIKRTAMGVPVINAICVILISYLVYLKVYISTKLCLIAWGFVTLFNLFIFIGTIVDTKKFAKGHLTVPNDEKFLYKINVTEIVSFVIFSVFIILIMIFYKPDPSLAFGL